MEKREIVEQRLKQILETYSRASVVGDFTQTILAVHTAIEDALNEILGDSGIDLSFNEKAQKILPDVYTRYNIANLTQQRNHIAHPIRVFSEAELRDTARKFVEFARLAWPMLFGSSPPPIKHPPHLKPVLTPSPGETKSHPSEEQPSQLPPEKPVQKPSTGESGLLSPRQRSLSTAKTPRKPQKSWLEFLRELPWLSLIIGFALGWLALATIGFIHQTSQQNIKGWQVSMIVLLLIAVVLTIFAIRGIVRFIFRLGIGRLAIVIALWLLGASLILVADAPSGIGWGERVSTAINQAIQRPATSILLVAQRAMLSGEHLSDNLFSQEGIFIPESGQVQDVNPVATAEHTLASPTVKAVFKSSSDQPSLTPANLGPQPKSGPTNDEITIGTSVAVHTDGTRLRGRDTPTLRGTIIAYYENGSRLTVVGGSQKADNYTWWQVENGDGRAWCAADFLVTIPK